MKNRERGFWIAALVLSLLLHLLSPSGGAVAQDEVGHRYQDILSRLLYFVGSMYVEAIDEKQLLLGAIRGVLAATNDPYTRFLDREEHREFNETEEGQRVGIGVEISREGEYPVVIAPIEGSPADKAGVLPGDRIVSIDGVSTRNIDFTEMVRRISGDAGSAVRIEVVRENSIEPIPIVIVRGLFHLEYCHGQILEGEIGYIRLTHFFGEETGAMETFRKLLVQFREKKVSGVIVDLRNNPGGHLNMAVSIAGYFLKKGQTVVIARGRDENAGRTYAASGETSILPEEIPVVVLINRGSASASEIVGGALQDHGRAKLIGTRSFGKASVQQIFRPLPDDTAALITVQKYYTPRNRSIHKTGLAPDIEVEEIRPDEEESFYLRRMGRTDFIKQFRARHPAYSPELVGLFREEARGEGWNFREELALFLLKREYGRLSSRTLDLEIDPQLRRAIKELRSK